MRLEHGGRKRGRGSAPMAEINIIPLVDVVLVLLIIFMATTAFVKESGLNMKLPSAKSSEVVPEENFDINVALTRDNKVVVDGKESTEDSLQVLMVQRAKANKETRVVIKGDENIEYKRVVRVMDMAKQAGLPKVALGTQLPEAR
jgi:biopolymer transport protein ExbD